MQVQAAKEVVMYDRRFDVFAWIVWTLLFLLSYSVWFILVELYTVDYFYSDMYPIWLTSQRFLDGVPVYGPEAIAALDRRWLGISETQATTGFAYPLTAALFTMPLSFFSLYTAHIIWVVGGCTALFTGLIKHHRYGPFLMLAFPFMEAIYLGQAHLWAIAGLVWWWWAHEKNLYRRAWVIAVLVCLLKPQVGLVAFLLSSYAFYRREPRLLGLYAAVVAAVVLSTLLRYPTWIVDWLTQVSSYRSSFRSEWQLLTLFTVVIGLLSLFTRFRGMLGQYIFTPYVGPYSMMGGLVLLVQAPLRWFLLAVLIICSYTSSILAFVFVVGLLGYLVWCLYQRFFQQSRRSDL